VLRRLNNWWLSFQRRRVRGTVYLRHYLREHIIETTIGALILIFFVIYFAGNMFITIPSGSVGVLWERFTGGTVLNRTLGEGFHIIMPWNKIFIYDARVQIDHEKLDVLSVDGLTLEIDVAFRFEVIRNSVPYLHQFVGPDYVRVVIAPDVAATARDVFSSNTPQEIFSERRKQIQSEILAAVVEHLHTAFSPNPNQPHDYVRVEDVLVRSIKLPHAVEAAIDSKNEQQQLNQEYDFRILREAKESQRKRIEALGIKDFQDIVSRGITNGYLRWRGIEATLELAKSPNAKIVSIGGGKDGLPIILGDSGGTSTSIAAADTIPKATVAQAPASIPSVPVPPAAPLTALLQQLGLAAKPTPVPKPSPSNASASPLNAPPSGPASLTARSK
jgi:regulator of protease activity HflC (stomatin/prohibitin superfamily)